MKDKILNFFKNKAIGYYLACGAALLAFVLMIVFYATISFSMPNSAGSKGPDTIGVFLICGLIVQIAFLVAPAYGIIQFIALILLGFAFYKELYCCPQVLAAIVTGVAYEGGSLPAHLAYIILFILIFGLAIAGAFVGYFKKNEDAIEDLKFVADKKPNLPVIVKSSSIVVVSLVAILVSTLVSYNIVKGLQGKTDKGSEEQEKVEKPNPITAEIKSVVDAYAYDFNPANVHFEKDDHLDSNGEFDFSSESGISSLPTNGQRDGVHLVYKFEGSYAEGWQGDYSKTYAYLYLWEDGKFAGTSGTTQFRGYWYDTDENGDEGSVLVMVTSNNANGEIIAYEQKGFYSWIVDLDSSVNQGRRIKAAGYMYYPEAALFIDTAETDLTKITVGASVDVSGWTAQRVLKNPDYSYSACFEDNSNKVTWKVNGSSISNSTINVTAAGTYEVTATWGELSASVSFTVA